MPCRKRTLYVYQHRRWAVKAAYQLAHGLVVVRQRFLDEKEDDLHPLATIQQVALINTSTGTDAYFVMKLQRLLDECQLQEA